MWWQNLTALQQVLWVLATVSTSFFLLSTLLSMIGFGEVDMDLDIDVDMDLDMPEADIDLDADAPEMEGHSATSEVLEYLSFRNIVAFTLGFSWTGILFHSQLGALALIPAVPVGGAFGWLNQWLSDSMKSLETSGNANLREAIGQQATVSVQIDENLQGTGKVVVNVGERELELLAQTEDGTPLNRGDRVQVYYVDNGILWVSKEDKLGLNMLYNTGT